MIPDLYIGIDPGKGGGLAFLGAHVEVVKMPETERDILDCLVTAKAGVIGRSQVKAYLELVRSSPQMGVVSAFTFGLGYGFLRMALIACGIPFDSVTPQKWQKALGCRSGGDKNVTKRRAQELFPDIKVTHAIADALLIAEYGRRKERGLL